MIVKKVTTGWVEQLFDTDTNRFVSQEFVPSPPSDFSPTFENSDRRGRPVEKEDTQEMGEFPFTMKQP